MGYSSYFIRDVTIPKPLFERVVNDVRAAIDKISRSGIIIAGPNGEGPPVLNAEKIAFNGSYKDGENYETFILSRVTEKKIKDDCGPKRRFQFCKTGRKPYDLAVCATLIIAKHHLGKRIAVMSDGGMEPNEWMPAVALVEKTLGYGKKFKFDTF